MLSCSKRVQLEKTTLSDSLNCLITCYAIGLGVSTDITLSSLWIMHASTLVLRLSITLHVKDLLYLHCHLTHLILIQSKESFITSRKSLNIDQHMNEDLSMS
jgi:hypothetical protein